VCKRIVILFCVVPFLANLASGQSVTTGGVAGTVADSNGNGLQATVRAVRFGSKQSFQVKSGANGTFNIAGLSAGEYELCATPSSTGYADSCLWGIDPTVQVTAGSITTGQSLVLEAAGTLQIQLTDSGGILSQTAAAAAPAAGTVKAHLMVGVLTDKKLFVTAPVTATSATGRNHAITVPTGRNVSLRLVAHGMTVAASAVPGTNVSGADISVTVASGKASPPLVFVVKGGAN